MEETRALEYTEQVKAFLFGKEVLQMVTQYMSRAIETANRAYGVTDQEFWKNLFLKTGARGDTVIETKDLKEDECPTNPYEYLDVQGSNKYLLYGGRRIVEEKDGRPVYATDSLNYFKKFHVDYFARAIRDKDGNWKAPGPRGEYYNVLNKAIAVRNKYAHDTVAKIREVTLESLEADLSVLQELTRPAGRSTGWERGLEPVKAFWTETQQQFQEQFGRVPVSVEAVSQELFMAEEGLTPEQEEAVSEAIRWLKLDCWQGSIYGEEPRELMDKLRRAPSVAALLGTTPFRTPEEAAAVAVAAGAQGEESLPPLEQPEWAPLPAEAAARLRRAGASLPREAGVLNALLDSFTLLADESIFLSEEGRELMTESLTPLLMERHQRLVVDESVVGALFRQFRGSVPYTQLELAEPEMAQLDPGQVEELKELRRQLHKTSKAAIKALRFMRARKCLEVASSPTDSRCSYENFFHLAQTYPAVRFLVLTHDRQLAEELGRVRGHNAVAVKPQLDGQLLPYRATHPAYEAMLRSGADRTAAQPAPAPARSQGVALPMPGERLTAEWPDGRRVDLRIGKKLNHGGEGVIYETGWEEMVAKVYFRKNGQRLEKLRRMAAHNPDIPGLCWPQALLYNARGEWLGFLMPRASGKELALTVFHPGRRNSNITAQGWTRKSLALIAANIASAFAEMHKKGILMGDVNPRNFLVNPDCSVQLVDCDSYQFGDFACPVGTILYTPPEIHKQMRATGKENYGYIRTEDNERYSLAVLLFEILMLGKAPYESRNNNNQDVQEAIIAGDFPYPYRSDEDSGESRPSGKLNTPVGQWRQIWSNTTYLVKTGFYNTFTGKNRLSASQWAETFREYARQIELGHSSDELVPLGYKDTSGREGGESTKMVNLVCQRCGRPFNLGEDVWRRRKSMGEPDLCSTHWEIQQNFMRREKRATCGICGKAFQTTVAEWMQRTQAKKPMLCPDCSRVQVVCSRCGKLYSEKRERMEELQARQVQPLCPDCFDTVFPRTVCQACGETFRPHQNWLESRLRSGKPILCKRCENK